MITVEDIINPNHEYNSGVTTVSIALSNLFILFLIASWLYLGKTWFFKKDNSPANYIRINAIFLIISLINTFALFLFLNHFIDEYD